MPKPGSGMTIPLKTAPGKHQLRADGQEGWNVRDHQGRSRKTAWLDTNYSTTGVMAEHAGTLQPENCPQFSIFRMYLVKGDIISLKSRDFWTI